MDIAAEIPPLTIGIVLAFRTLSFFQSLSRGVSIIRKLRASIKAKLTDASMPIATAWFILSSIFKKIDGTWLQ